MGAAERRARELAKQYPARLTDPLFRAARTGRYTWHEVEWLIDDSLSHTLATEQTHSRIYRIER